MRLIMLTCNIIVLHVNTIISHFDIIIMHVNFNLLHVDIGKSLVHITISDFVIIYFAWGGGVIMPPYKITKYISNDISIYALNKVSDFITVAYFCPLHAI